MSTSSFLFLVIAYNEYCNITHPFGLWKDTGVRLEGPAVRSLTITFFENWYGVKKNSKR